MRNWIVRWLANILALFIITQAHIGISVKNNNPATYILAIVVMSLVNALIRPIIMFFVWPINCLTFGLLGFLINVILFQIIGSGVIPGFQVSGFYAALI